MRKLFFILVLATLILPGCQTAPTAAPIRPTATPVPPRPTTSAAELELSDPAKTIEVVSGDQFTITVKTDLSSDYHWEIAEELDEDIVAYVWKDHISDDPGDPNANGRDVWRFQAVAPGQATINLGYYEGQTEQTAQKLVFNVVVK